MRYLPALALGTLIALSSTGASVSQVLDDPRIQRCKSGLERGVQACNNMHDIGSGNWHKCIDYSIVTYQQCVTEVAEHMTTLPG